jgi:hypothetical protein
MVEIEMWRMRKMGLVREGGRQRQVMINQRDVKLSEERRAKEIFEKRLEVFKSERTAVQSKPIPITENLARIDNLLDTHIRELYNSMILFKGMKHSVENTVESLNFHNESLSVISKNL